MSDLCHNCGDSHFPQPCSMAINFCPICHLGGHLYVFCPTGPKAADPNHFYYMLCHNCDTWCVDPDPLLWLLWLLATSHLASNVYNIAKIRVATASEVINMLKNGSLQQEILAEMAKPIQPMRPMLPPMRTSSLAPFVHGTGVNSPPVRGFHPNASVPMIAAKPMEGVPLTPGPDNYATAFPGAMNYQGSSMGTYGGTSVSGPPAQASTMLHHAATVPSQPDASEEPPVKRQRAAPKPRCDDCKLTKRRCNHLVPDLPEIDTSSVMPSATPQTPSLGAGQASGAGPQQSTVTLGHDNHGDMTQHKYNFVGGGGDPYGATGLHTPSWKQSPASLLGPMQHTGQTSMPANPFGNPGHGIPAQGLWLQEAPATMPDLAAAPRGAETAAPGAAVSGVQGVSAAGAARFAGAAGGRAGTEKPSKMVILKVRARHAD
ncbi:hypothetical protein LTR53_002659 [Teratosphaeriaceae sp. CCFEE 6253]|nr:hypothetical protein LTR53_002659 [Teratosphaeriaceae sp. CCFEE 6253]